MSALRGVRRAIFPTAMLAVTLLAAACDNPVGDDEAHAEGLALLDAQGNEVVRYLHGTGTATGRIAVAPGSSVLLRVRLVDENGNQIGLAGSDYSLQDPSVVTAVFASAELEGTDGLRITGKSAGSTEVVLPVRHGGHTEFSARLPLSVASP